MLLEIKTYPDPVLKKKAEEVKEVTDEVSKLCQDMTETMTEKKGIGLAAPQIGVLKRIIIIQTESGPQCYINPKILKKSREEEIVEEGCLSFPSYYLKIKRPKSIEMEFISLKGEKVVIEVEGLLARVLQHEVDHLDGILIIDKFSFWERLKLKKKAK